MGGEGGAKLGHAGQGRVLVAAILEGCGRRLDHIFGTVIIGKALAEIDRAMLIGQRRHHGEDGGAGGAQQLVLWAAREAGRLGRQHGLGHGGGSVDKVWVDVVVWLPALPVQGHGNALPLGGLPARRAKTYIILPLYGAGRIVASRQAVA
jgi:hypothetical protein